MARKTARISVTVDPELKRKFLSYADKHGCSGAAIARALMRAFVDSCRDPKGFRAQLRADVEHPAPALTPAAAFQLARSCLIDIAIFVRVSSE